MTANFSRLAAQMPDPLAIAGLFLLAGFLITRLALPHHPVWRFLFQLACFAGVTIMLAVAGVSPSVATVRAGWTLNYLGISLLKIAWWLSAAWLLSGFLRAALIYKRQPRETILLQDLLSGAIYLGAVLAVVAYVFNVAVDGVLAASGVIAIVLGLALQSTLGDVFSGIVLNLAKPYHPGDWVILDAGLQGRVIETNWRATQILTDSNDLAIVPNSVIAKAKLINASAPGRDHGATVAIRLDPGVAPARCCTVLETALLSCNLILRTPPPVISVRRLDAVALEIDVQFFVSDFDLLPVAQNEVFDLIFRHCLSAGIRLAPPAGSGFALAPMAPRPSPADASRRLLDRLPIFAPLSDDERVLLAEKMTRGSFKAGDVVVEQGAVAHALFILTAGVVVALQGTGAKEIEVMRLAPGDCFGQAGILAGATSIFQIKALTRVNVFEIAKEDLAPILQERPAIAAELGLILAQRQAMGKSRLEELALPEKQGDTLAERLAERVKDLFGLKS
jgi:small-conductance mechanosensitive channel/CRP-like cAMP-binding protein